MHVIVTGWREWVDPATPEICLNLLEQWSRAADEELVIIHGAARGWDKLCRDWAEWAETQGSRVRHIPYPAPWNLHGKPAGRIRNHRMWSEHWHHTDLCLAGPGPDSIGTIHCMELARQYGCPLWTNQFGAKSISRPPQARLVPEIWTTTGAATDVPPPTTL